MHEACSDGRFEDVKNFIETGDDVNNHDDVSIEQTSHPAHH